MKDSNNNRDKQEQEKELTTRNKKPIKSIRGFRESLADEESLEQIKEFGNEICIANIWDNPADDIS